MGLITEKELKQQIKSGSFARAYLFYGDESYLKKHYVELICKKTVSDDFVDFNFHKFDGKEVSIDEIAQAVEALPMMSPMSCVLVNDLDIGALSDTDFDKLISVLSDLPETCILILHMNSVKTDKRKGSKFGKALKAVEQNGEVVELNKLGLNDLVKLVLSGAKKRGCDFEYNEATYFVNSVGFDMNTVLNELDKLCFYVKSGKINKFDIDEVCIKSVEAKVFDLSKALLKNNSDMAFSILNTLFSQKVEPVLISGTLISVYVDMYRAKVAITSGSRAEDVARHFNYKNKEFRLRNGARDSSRLSLTQLRSCLDKLSMADELLKGSGLDSRLVLEQCMSGLLVTANKN
ncbi:MAG TPA: DNA polymerase III subunit delta [Clostridia bacterium]|nr:DNA polymerase III subunit delta [Clostridia bacterium]